jgi:TorA maturation chaperone TorD
MVHDYSPPTAPVILRFYARCFLFPYEEMTYELQHLFRQIELLIDDHEGMYWGHDILSVLNTFQGEDIQNLRTDYVFLFTGRYQSEPVCPIIAAEFSKRFRISYDSDLFIDLFIDSGLQTDEPDALDSIVNYLEYLALLYTQFNTEFKPEIDPEKFLDHHIFPWIPQFCDILSKSANISFYRELGASLKRYLLS